MRWQAWAIGFVVTGLGACTAARHGDGGDTGAAADVGETLDTVPADTGTVLPDASGSDAGAGAGAYADGGGNADAALSDSTGGAATDGGMQADALADVLTDAATDTALPDGSVDSKDGNAGPDVFIADVPPLPVPTFCEDATGTTGGDAVSSVDAMPTTTDNILGVPIPIPPAPMISGFAGGTCGCEGPGPVGAEVPGECYMAYYDFSGSASAQFTEKTGYGCSLKPVFWAHQEPPSKAPSRVETKEWDEHGWLTTTSYWEFGKHLTTKTWTYDEEGHLLEEKTVYPAMILYDPQEVLPIAREVYEYDEQWRVSKRTVFMCWSADGPETIYSINYSTYYPDGNLKSVTMTSGQGKEEARKTYVWNDSNLLAREEWDSETCEWVTTDGYDTLCSSDKLDGIPESGTEYEYDELGRLIKERDFVGGILKWHPTPYGMGDGNGVVWYDYDELGRLAARYWSFPEWDGVKDDAAVLYVYDDYDRLTAEATWSKESGVYLMKTYSYDCWSTPTPEEPPLP